MNKFQGPRESDEDYKLVVDKIRDILEKIRKGTPLERGDSWIREKYYNKQRTDIIRLSGECRSTGDCYINLALVEQHAQAEAQRHNLGGLGPKSSPFALHDRLRISTQYDEDLRFELPTLFDERKIPNSGTLRPKRILIRGRAGVGKSTLCKKIVHEYYCRAMWKNMFARVIWVALRELKRENGPCNLEDLLRQIFLRGSPEDVLLAKTLRKHVDDSEAGATLFVLDGLDEVSEIVKEKQHSNNHRAHELLVELLNKPNVIITARPCAVFPAVVQKPDLELETIGFTPDQVAKYLTKFASAKDVEKMQSYLQKNRLMKSLVRIPILLDALCFTWNEVSELDDDREVIPETMTAVYDAITEKLWIKDLERLGNPTTGECSSAQIADGCADQSKILEELAFDGLHNNIVEFQKKHWNSIPDVIQNRDSPIMALRELFGRLSFLRTSDSSTADYHQSFHFIHLTFQEYFAAKYYVRKWRENRSLRCMEFGHRKQVDITCRAFLQEHKYDARYDIMWRFVAGLLDGGTGDEIVGFFKKIKSDPIDLLGPSHQRLIMHCLGEAVGLPSGRFRADMEHQLSQWLLFECLFKGSASLASESEFPDNALHSTLEGCTQNDKVTILRALGSTGRYLSLRTVPHVDSVVIDLRVSN